MAQVIPDAPVIELGVPGADENRNQRVRVGRRPLLIAVVVLCLLALAASAPGRPVLGDPLWTGSVSLNGFTLGPDSLYVAQPDGKAVAALDLRTGRRRWTRDIVGLPQSVSYVGGGVAVVMTRPPSSDDSSDDPGRPQLTITLVRDGTGEQIAQTTGESFLRSADGRLLLVFSQRLGDPTQCGAPDANCMDITAWDLGSGVMAWGLNLGPDTGYVLSYLDSRVEALAEVDNDGAIRLRDLATGAVTGTMSLSRELPVSGDQVGLVRDLFLTARRGTDGITLTAYRRPSLSRDWSVVVPDFTPMDDQGDGIVFLWQCGPEPCVTVNGGGTWIINQATGAVGSRITIDVFARLGGGVFLGTQLHQLSARTGQPTNGLIVSPDGRTLGEVMVGAVVDWFDGGDRVLVTQQGRARTGFVVIDEAGTARTIGSVPGVGLTCSARASILACSDAAGKLRVWRLPV